MGWFKKKKKEDVFKYKIIASESATYNNDIIIALEFKNDYREIDYFDRLIIADISEFRETGRYHFFMTMNKKEIEREIVIPVIIEHIERLEGKMKDRIEKNEIIQKIQLSGSIRLEEKSHETN